MKPKHIRQTEAQERQAAYNALTVEQKIARARVQRGNSEKQLAKLRREAGR